MRSEFHAVIADLSHLRQTEYLEPAAISEDRFWPIHEAMESARLGDNVQTRADVEVIGVAQQDLSADLLQFPRVERFNTGLSAHRHINGRVHLAVNRRQPAQTRLRPSICLQ